MPFDPNLRNTSLFLAIFILAFFPNVFQYVLQLPLLPFTYLFSTDIQSATVQKLRLPVCTCCPPASCYQPQQIESPANKMAWFQKQFTLPSKPRGAYLITNDVTSALPELKNYKVGMLHLFIQHTSCGLTLNENWDSDVRADMSDAFDRLAPEDRKGELYRHDAEGLDDMPAHIKSVLAGASVTVPITGGKLNTGTWQGIYLMEFRAAKHSRRVVATIQGETF
ncbi:UPF0047-domain-containing protein [Polychaeton citri CBS 116435]|uniref:UPF0047-domain-containing protein n=1 Tax=Polychaeton citri CBS 116435 TaxID=1314669 RepID=A0A9P4QI60_9PEZI|nr:UPF0047-domain-containing protein [Polychaeton citri CBS 116435]